MPCFGLRYNKGNRVKGSHCHLRRNLETEIQKLNFVRHNVHFDFAEEVCYAPTWI